MINTQSDTLQAVQAAVSDKVASVFEQYKLDSIASKISEVIPVTTSAVTFHVPYPIGVMEELLGPKQVESLSIQDLTAAVKNFHKTLGMSSYDIEDDNLGIYQGQINQIANVASRQYDILLANAIIANSSNTVTGEAMFANSQTWGVGATAQDNLLGLALTEDNLKTAISTLESFKGPKGNILGAHATHLVVPPALKWTALSLVAPVNAAAGFNVLAGAVEVVVLPELQVAPTTWYLFDCMAGKPFYLLNRQDPSVSTKDDTFESKQIKVSVEMRAVAVNGLWSSCVKSVG
jgi:phage major head subunit gpT-like protein